MELRIEQAGAVATVQPSGRIDSATAKDFGERVCGLIRNGATRVVIDFQDIAYISSAGFRALLIAGKLVEETQGRLALCGLNGEVRRLFDIAAFTDLFVILPTREECIAKLERQ